MSAWSKALVALSIAALLIGAVVLVFTAMVLRFAVQDDAYLLTTRYDPDGDATYQRLRTYENLYDWTGRIMGHRNRFAMRFHYALGVSFVALGAILIAWTVDRERVRRRV